MTKDNLIAKLNKIYNDLDSLPGDSSIKSANRDIENVRDDLGNIIEEIEQTEIESDKD